MKTMKKMVMAVAAFLALTACNEELGPEYSTPAEFGEVSMTPVQVSPTDPVSLEVVITSPYGLNSVQVGYYINDDISTIKSSKPTLYQGQSQTKVVYKGQNVIPAQEAGTKVTFQVVAETPFSVLSGTKFYSYTVTDGGDEPIKPGEGDQGE